MAWNQYTRIEVYLPANTSLEQDAAAQAEAYVRDTFRGATATSREEPSLHGYWFRDDGSVVEDDIVVVTADTDRTSAEVDRNVAEILQLLVRYYAIADSPQDAFWITQSPIQVFTP